MTVYTLDPLSDARWAEFIGRNPSASVFHTVPWLEAVRRTYGYTPVVYTTSAPSFPLTNGVVLCQIKSWLTGKRLVSLPFSDHCDPLLDEQDAAAAIWLELKRQITAGKYKYVELRPTRELPGIEGAVAAAAACFHMLDLSAPAEELLRKMHKTSIQQPIKRAEREGLTVEAGNSERLLGSFYRLLLLTRRRHQLPPQPIEWFRNLAASMGERMQVSVAFKGETAIASIVTLRHADKLVYKYSCSDSQYKNLGATPLLLWKAILKAKKEGATCMDLGRSDADNPGLVTFKNNLGAQASELVYLRWSQKQQSLDVAHGRSSGAIKRVMAMMPDFVLETTGRILYRHIG